MFKKKKKKKKTSSFVREEFNIQSECTGSVMLRTADNIDVVSCVVENGQKQVMMCIVFVSL